MDQHAKKRFANEEILLDGDKKPRTIFPTDSGLPFEPTHNPITNDNTPVSTPDEDVITVDDKNAETTDAPHNYTEFKLLHFLPLPIIVVNMVEDGTPIDLSVHTNPVFPMNDNPQGCLYMQVGPDYQGGTPFYLKVSEEPDDIAPLNTNA